MKLIFGDFQVELDDSCPNGVIYLYPTEYRCPYCKTNVLPINGPVNFRCKNGHDFTIMNLMRQIGVISNAGSHD